MSVRIQLTILVHMMTWAVMFGVGALAVLSTPLATRAAILLPVVIIISFLFSIPIAWLIAPRLRARFWADRSPGGDFISGPAEP